MKQIKDGENHSFSEKYRDFYQNKLNSATTKSTEDSVQINEFHRLWLICDKNLTNNLPCKLIFCLNLSKVMLNFMFSLASLIFDSVKFTPKISSYTRTHDVCMEIAKKKKDDVEEEIANEASILHCVIAHTSLIDRNTIWYLKYL